MIAIGVDIGGTTSRVAAVESGIARSSSSHNSESLDDFKNPSPPWGEGRVSSSRSDSTLASVLSSRIDPTPSDSTGDALIGWIANSICEIQSQLAIERAPIGLALPGPVDRDRGLLLRSVNLPFLENRPIVRELQDRTCQPVTLWTDAEAATWGEYSTLDLAPTSFAHLRFGTGVACGIIVDGKFACPTRTNGGHLDALVVDHSPTAIICPCGKRGCLETITSGAALTRNGQDLAALQLAFRSGDERTRKQINAAARAINSAITNIARQFGVSTIVLGGGVIENLPALFDGVVRAIQESGSVDGIAISRHNLGDAAGLIGAANLAARAAGNG